MVPLATASRTWRPFTSAVGGETVMRKRPPVRSDTVLAKVSAPPYRKSSDFGKLDTSVQLTSGSDPWARAGAPLKPSAVPVAMAFKVLRRACIGSIAIP